jgi:hypothetical protein
MSIVIPESEPSPISYLFELWRIAPESATSSATKTVPTSERPVNRDKLPVSMSPDTGLSPRSCYLCAMDEHVFDRSMDLDGDGQPISQDRDKDLVRTRCIRCSKNLRDTMFEPCGHVALCVFCARFGDLPGDACPCAKRHSQPSAWFFSDRLIYI